MSQALTVAALLDRIDELGRLARRLPPPSARRPEAFHEARDELGHDIAGAVRDLRRLLGLR